MTHPRPAPAKLQPWLAGVIVLLVIGVIVAAFGNPNRNEDPAPAAETEEPAPAATTPTPAAPPATDTRTPITFSSDGQYASEKVAMNGDYSVVWQTLGTCYYSGSLRGGDYPERVFTSSDAVATGENNINDLDPADYYIDVITGPAPRCGWSVTLTPN